MTLVEDFVRNWRSQTSLNEPLAKLVIQTSSRAAGCWRLDNGHLHLAGFGWAPDMPDDVSQGFQAATQCVPIDQTGLGIVKAVVGNQPAIGRRDPSVTDINHSASWIARFGANTSLAVPIRIGATGTINGVLAVSTEALIEEGDTLWQTLLQLAEEIGNVDAGPRTDN